MNLNVINYIVHEEQNVQDELYLSSSWSRHLQQAEVTNRVSDFSFFDDLNRRIQSRQRPY